MNPRVKRTAFIIAIALLTLAAQRPSLAGSATWKLDPATNEWTTASNWTPATVPNGPSDTATFGASNVSQVSVTGLIEVAGLTFDSTAGDYSISTVPSSTSGTVLFLTGPGINNASGRMQNFSTEMNGTFSSTIHFENNATAGDLTSFSGPGGFFVFSNSSSAGSGSFDVTGAGIFQASMDFDDFTTAADATINVNQTAVVYLFGFASAGNAVFTFSTGGFILIGDSATADHATFTTMGGRNGVGSEIFFSQFATAADASFTALGGTTSGEPGGNVQFHDFTTAADGTFTINGGAAAGLTGALLTLDGNSTTGNATITANGGVGGSEGGAVVFGGNATGGTASISLSGNGELDISTTHLSGVTIGSLAGNGLVFLGAKTLTIGSNNQSTTFSGVIQETGEVTKIGTGTLTLSGSNTYTGTTTVSGGVLNAANRRGSATGTGAVKVNTGTLGGKGIVSGATTIGTGSGAGAFLAPAVGSNKQTTLTIQSALTLNADATYTCTFKAKKNKALSDLIKANGVTINGATLNLAGTTQGSLRQGLTLTLISNTGANPISGTFSNLPDGGIVTVNGNNLQASYTGGDGNDLTLTVVL
jgi:autotransporter-associated beta strand protein